MGFPSPAKDYIEKRLEVSDICSYDANCRVVETSKGYAVINVSLRAKSGDLVLFSFCDRVQFAKVQGLALITPDGEAIEGEALDDANILGVVTFLINRARQNNEGQ